MVVGDVGISAVATIISAAVAAIISAVVVTAIIATNGGDDEFVGTRGGGVEATNLQEVLTFDVAMREAEVCVLAAVVVVEEDITCLLYTSPSPRDQRGSRMPSSA